MKTRIYLHCHKMMLENMSYMSPATRFTCFAGEYIDLVLSSNLRDLFLT